MQMQTQLEQTVDAPWRAWVRRTTPASLRAMYWNARQRRERNRIIRGLHHEPRLCAALRRLIRPGFTCVDVGANHGLVTIPMAHWAGARGCVHAFEAHPDNVKTLWSNLEKFDLIGRVHVHGLAVNDGIDARVALYGGRGGSSSEWNIVGRDADGQVAPEVGYVCATSLDRCLAAGTRIDLVKIDVEGAESLVLAGMSRILRENAPILAIECHSADNWSACRELVKLGYELTDPDGCAIGTRERCPGPHVIAMPGRAAVAAG